MTCLCGRNPSQVLLPPEEAGEPCRKQSNPVPFMRQIFILNPSYFVLSSLFPEEVGPDALGKTAKADFSLPWISTSHWGQGSAQRCPLGLGQFSEDAPACLTHPADESQASWAALSSSACAFSMDLCPGDVVLHLFVSWEDVIFISLIGFQTFKHFVWRGKGKKKRKWQQ